MTDRPPITEPAEAPATEPLDIDAYLARFAWHPEPELIGFRDAATSRTAMERLGEATWTTALDFLYGHGVVRAMGDPSSYALARQRYYASEPTGDRGGPGPAPADPAPADAVLAEFSSRLAGRLLSSQHPRQFSYFTPPPLPMSIAGELLAQMANQGVDVWHAGPFAAFVEEEVVRWLDDLIGYDEQWFGVLTSGGVMANFMAMALARDVQLGRLRGLDRPPRGRDLEDARVYAQRSDALLRRARARRAGLPGVDAGHRADPTTRFRLRGAPVAAAVARDRAAGLTPFAIAAWPGPPTPARSMRSASRRRRRRGRAVAPRRRGVRRCGPAVGARRRPRPGLERADSVTVDPHKWFFQAYDIGGLMVRDGVDAGRRCSAAARRSTTAAARRPARPPRSGDDPTTTRTTATSSTSTSWSFEGTRRWRALKLWMTWKHLGHERLRPPDRGQRRPRGLSRPALRRSPTTSKRCRPSPELSVVCFRHLPGGAAPAPARSSTPTRIDSSARSKRPATAG